MCRLIAILILSLATSLQAGEVKIVETETGVIAEYTGTPASTSNDNDVPAAAVNNDNASRVEFITTQIEQLKKEAAEIMKLTGNETDEELALINAQADAKNQQIEAYTNELGKLTDIAQKKEVDALQAKEEQPLKKLNYRQEKKKQKRELKMLRTSPPPSSDPD